EESAWRAIDARVNEDLATAEIGTVAVHDTEGLFIIQNPRPADQLSAGREGEGGAEVRDLTLVLSAVPQDGVLGTNGSERRDANIRRRRGVEAVPARGAERAEAGEIRVQTRGPGLQAGAARTMGVVRAKHRLAQILVRRRITDVVVGEELIPQRFLRSGERLLRAVIDARNAEREQLNGDAGDDLVIRRGIAGKAHLVAGDVIVVV